MRIRDGPMSTYRMAGRSRVRLGSTIRQSPASAGCGLFAALFAWLTLILSFRPVLGSECGAAEQEVWSRLRSGTGVGTGVPPGYRFLHNLPNKPLIGCRICKI